MNQEAWLRFLDTLPKRLRDALQIVMQRVDFVILSYANRHIEEIQRLERKVDRLEQKLNDRDVADRVRAVGE